MKQAAIGIVKIDRNNVILIKRQDIPIWTLPGGGIDENETPEEAVVREVLEETGLSVAIQRKIGEYTPLNKLCTLTHVYECTPISGTLQLTNETQDIRAFPMDDLPAAFFIVHHDWLIDANDNSPHVIKKPINRVTYLGVLIYFFYHPLLVVRAILARLGFPINTKP